MTERIPVLPDAFVCRMQRLLGAEYGEFEASYGKPRVQGLRLNGLKGEEAELKTCCRNYFPLEPVPWAETGFYYPPESRPGKHPYHEAGLYYIQEPSAMAVAELLAPEPGEYVLDLCAAPGGKSTQAAVRLCGRGLLVSNEIHPARAKILSQNVERMGIANAVVTNMDSKSLTRWFTEFFDKIVVDAPCSGEGMFRKDEDARREWSLEHVALCSRRQQELLDNAAVMLKPGGRLVYSTCTFAPEENEGSIQQFLERHPEFSVEKQAAYEGFSSGHPEWVPGGKGCKELADTFRIWPHRVDGEGHYLAMLLKDGTSRNTAEESGKNIRAGKSRDRNGTGHAGAPACFRDREQEKAFREFCRETMKGGSCAWEREPGQYLMFGEQLYYAPAGLPELKGMKVLRPGLHLGTLKKNRFEPSHALALYLKKEDVQNTADLPADGPEVIRYLKGETLEGRLDGRKGWTLVTTDGFSLGWAKQAGGLLKNHYPKGLRWM